MRVLIDSEPCLPTLINLINIENPGLEGVALQTFIFQGNATEGTHRITVQWTLGTTALAAKINEAYLFVQASHHT